MGYDIKVRCDNEKCRKSVEVPQVGALPDPDWIIVTRAVPRMVKSNPAAEAPDTVEMQVEKYVSCSAKCAIILLEPVAATEEPVEQVVEAAPRRRRKKR